MADNAPESVRTIGYSLKVTAELNAKAGKLTALLAEQTMQCHDTKHQIEDRFDDIYLEPQLVRNGDTNYVDQDSVRRWIRKPKPFDVAKLIGRHDMQSTQVDLKMPPAKAMATGIRRYHDDQFFSGFFGNAYVGEYGDTAVPFTPANIIPAGGAGITLDKLHALLKAYDDNNVDTEEEMPILLIDNQGRVDLHKIPEYISADWNDHKPLVRGEIKPFLNIRFVQLNMLDAGAFPSAPDFVVPSAGQISLPSFVPSGLQRGVWTESFVDIGLNRSKKAQQQIYVEACSAITRIEEKKCFQLQCINR
jgi:hypothetical protein